jgi:hypothetical protein
VLQPASTVRTDGRGRGRGRGAKRKSEATVGEFQSEADPPKVPDEAEARPEEDTTSGVSASGLEACGQPPGDKG